MGIKAQGQSVDSSAFQVVCEVQKLGSGSLVVKSRIQYWDPVAKERGLVVQMSEHRAKDLGSGFVSSDLGWGIRN